jgi:hypothetical protein
LGHALAQTIQEPEAFFELTDLDKFVGLVCDSNVARADYNARDPGMIEPTSIGGKRHATQQVVTR